MTRRAMAVAAATLCAPIVAAVGLAAIAAAGVGEQPELGALPGSEGLHGTTVAAPSPAASQVSVPAETQKRRGKDEVAAAADQSQSAPKTTHDAPQQPAPGVRAPVHKPPVHTAPKPPTRGGDLDPPTPAPPPTFDPSEPGAPTSTGSTGGTDTTGSGSDSSTAPSYPDSQDGQSGSG